MENCPSCAAVVEATADACPACGAPLGARREAILQFSRQGGLSTSPWTIFLYLPIAFGAGVYAYGGWLFVGLFFTPYLVVPALLAIAVLFYFGMEIVAFIVNAVGRLSYLSLLAACAVLSFPLAIFPARLDQAGRGKELLLEVYADSLIAYAILLYIVATVWWGLYSISGHRRP
jgi:hypothetical protein